MAVGGFKIRKAWPISESSTAFESSHRVTCHQGICFQCFNFLAFFRQKNKFLKIVIFWSFSDISGQIEPILPNF